MPVSFRNTKKVSSPTRKAHWVMKKLEEEENRVREAKQLAISEANQGSTKGTQPS